MKGVKYILLFSPGGRGQDGRESSRQHEPAQHAGVPHISETEEVGGTAHNLWSDGQRLFRCCGYRFWRFYRGSGESWKKISKIFYCFRLDDTPSNVVRAWLIYNILLAWHKKMAFFKFRGNFYLPWPVGHSYMSNPGSWLYTENISIVQCTNEGLYIWFDGDD